MIPLAEQLPDDLACQISSKDLLTLFILDDVADIGHAERNDPSSAGGACYSRHRQRE
jgi:hypothetical protein